VSDDSLDDLHDDNTSDDAGYPDFRVTVAKGRLFLVDWSPALTFGGPPGQLFLGRESAGVAIADVTVAADAAGERDAIVEFLSAGKRAKADGVITEWARATGYRRIWFSDSVVEVGSDPAPIGLATTKCTSCRARFREGSPEFWLGVRDTGRFPSICRLCGGAMPQWTIEKAHDSGPAFVSPPREAHAST
jgi:hypothetical protein